MKKLAIIVSTIVFAAVAVVAQPKYNNPSSTYYKTYKISPEANKSYKNADGNIEYAVKSNTNLQSASNYKNSFSSVNNGGDGAYLVMPYNNAEQMEASRNYKWQFSTKKKQNIQVPYAEPQQPTVRSKEDNDENN